MTSSCVEYNASAHTWSGRRGRQHRQRLGWMLFSTITGPAKRHQHRPRHRFVHIQLQRKIALAYSNTIEQYITQIFLRERFELPVEPELNQPSDIHLIGRFVRASQLLTKCLLAFLDESLSSPIPKVPWELPQQSNLYVGSLHTNTRVDFFSNGNVTHRDTACTYCQIIMLFNIPGKSLLQQLLFRACSRCVEPRGGSYYHEEPPSSCN